MIVLVLVGPAVFVLLQGFEQESEENVGSKEDEGEDDGAAQATPSAHAL